MAVRTPLCKSKKGSFKDTPTEALMAPLFEHVIKTTKMNPKDVDDITIGNVLQPGAGITNVRMASFLGGFPDTTCSIAINRMCSSGLEAIA